MLSLDKLAALDLLIWLSNSERAAAVALTDQSTISRRSRSAQQQFRIHLHRRGDHWQLDGDTQLLQLERLVHQRARFKGRQPLRLQVPYWTQRASLQHLPDEWCSNPMDSARTCDNPVQLLRDRVIDACLVTPTQMPARTDDLLILDLYHQPIALTLFPDALCPDPFDQLARRRQSGDLQLRVMPFLPRSCRVRSGNWLSELASDPAGTGGWDELQPPARRDAMGRDAMAVAFLTPEMREAQQDPWLVDERFEPYPYVERLVLLAEHSQEPAVQHLLEHLFDLFAPEARRA